MAPDFPLARSFGAASASRAARRDRSCPRSRAASAARAASATSFPQPASPGRGPVPRLWRGARKARRRAAAAALASRGSWPARRRQQKSRAARRGPEGRDRHGGRGRGDRRGPAAPARLPRRAAASSAAFCGSSGDWRSAAIAPRRSGRKGSSRSASTPKAEYTLPAGPRSCSGLARATASRSAPLVLSPVEQVLDDGGGAFEGEAPAPDAGPWPVDFCNGIQCREGCADKIEGVRLGKLAKRPARPGPGGRAGRFGGGRARRESRRGG